MNRPLSSQQLADILLTPLQLEQLARWRLLLWPLPAAQQIGIIDETAKDMAFENQLALVTREMEHDHEFA